MSDCQQELRAAGKPYPRTCQLCGLGPCKERPIAKSPSELDRLRAEAARLQEASGRVRALVKEQAEDEGLWFEAQTAAEAYLQQALRELHAAVDADK